MADRSAGPEAERREARRRRMFAARHALEGRRGGDVTLADLAAAVARALGGHDGPDPSVVARWLKGVSEPRTTAMWEALATALGVDPGWLAFGEATSARGPGADRDESVPVVVVDRGVDVTPREPRAESPRRRKANGG